VPFLEEVVVLEPLALDVGEREDVVVPVLERVCVVVFVAVAVSDGLRELVEDRVEVPEGVSAADWVDVLVSDVELVDVLEAEIVAVLEAVVVSIELTVGSPELVGERVAVREADRVRAADPEALEERLEETDGLIVLELDVDEDTDALRVDVRLDDKVAVPDRETVVVREVVVVADSVRLEVALLLSEIDPVDVIEEVVVLETVGEPLDVRVSLTVRVAVNDWSGERVPVGVLLELAVEEAVREADDDLDEEAVSDALLLDVAVRDPVAVPDELLVALADRVGVAVALVDFDALEDRVELNVAVAERLRAGERVDVTEEDCVFELLGDPDGVLEPVFVFELEELPVDVRLVDGERVLVVVLEEDRVDEAEMVETPDSEEDKDGRAVIDDERDPTDVFVAAPDRVDVRVAVAVKEPKRVLSANVRP
jgi:hypothetical protein